MRPSPGLLCAGAAAFALVCSGCTVDDLARRSSPAGAGPAAAAHVAPGPLNAAERDWLERLGEWVPIASSGVPGHTTCARDLREDVGRAPTPRLRRLERLAKRACHRLEAAPTAKDARRRVDRLVELMHAYQRASGDARPLPAVSGLSSRSRVERRLSRVVTDLTGKASEVRCWSRTDWQALTEAWPHVELEGYVRGDERVHLVNSVCAPLVRLYRGLLPASSRARLELAWAVNVLAHESEHRAGVANEATAQCHAMQKVRRVARALGAGKRLAAALAQLMWSELYEGMPEGYRSAQCRDGGRLDLRPASAVWP